MPYIPQKQRLLVERLGAIGPGELNYEITQLIKRYWEKNEPNYRTINDIIGALEGAKAEFQRRIVAPYEDKKCEENGDVYS